MITVPSRVGSLPPPLVDAAVSFERLGEHVSELMLVLEQGDATAASATDMIALVNAAVQSHKDGQKDLALRRYDEILQLQPQHTQTLHLRGALRRDQGDLEGALADLTAALATAPRFIDARVAAATARACLHVHGRIRRARRGDHNS